MLAVCGRPVVFIVGLGLPTIGRTRSSDQKVAKGSHFQALAMREIPQKNLEGPGRSEECTIDQPN